MVQVYTKETDFLFLSEFDGCKTFVDTLLVIPNWMVKLKWTKSERFQSLKAKFLGVLSGVSWHWKVRWAERNLIITEWFWKQVFIIFVEHVMFGLDLESQRVRGEDECCFVIHPVQQKSIIRDENYTRILMSDIAGSLGTISYRNRNFRIFWKLRVVYESSLRTLGYRNDIRQ